MTADAHIADELPHADPDRQQEQQRLEEPAQEDVPDAPVRENVALDQSPRPPPHAEERQRDDGRRCGLDRRADRRGRGHELNRHAKLRTPKYAPTAMQPTRTAMCTAIAPASN